MRASARVMHSPAAINVAAGALSSYGDKLVSRELYGLSITPFKEASDLYAHTVDRTRGADTLRNLGVSYSQIGNYGLALQSLDRAAALYLDDKNDTSYAYTLREKAVVREKLGDFDLALQLVEDALSRLKAADTSPTLEQERQPMRLAGCYETQASILKQLGLRHGAAQALEAVARLFETRSDDFSRMIAQLRRAELASLLNDMARAEHFYSTARVLAKRSHDLSLETFCDREVGKLWLDRGDPTRARPHLQSALEKDRTLAARDFVVQDLTALASCDEAEGLRASALSRFDEALKLWTSTERGNVIFGASMSVADPPSELMAGPLRLLLRRDNARVWQAFNRLQLAKSGELVRLVSGAWQLQSLTPEEKSELTTLQLKLSTAREQLLSSVGTDTNGPLSVAAREATDRTTTDLELFWQRCSISHGVSLSRVPSEPITPDQLRRELPPRTAIIDFLVTPSETIVFCAARKRGNGDVRLWARTLLISAHELEARVKVFRDDCQAGTQHCLASASALYDALIGPFSPLLEGQDRLVISPSGPLYALPFPALRHKQRFLNDDFSVVYLPSLTMLPLMSPKAGDVGQPPAGLHGPAVIVANPDLEGLTLPWGASAATALSPLPWALEEAANVARHFDRGGIVLSGTAATEEAITAYFGSAHVIHVAAHAFFNKASPMYSGIVLARARGSQAGDTDGILEAWELAATRVSVDLLVLSACDSGLGQSKLGEGVIGFSWAALTSGVHSLVVTQWKVDDWATSVVMDRFYGNLQTGMSKDRALQQATRSLAQFPGYTQPKYWAGFMLIGSP